jgi:hypothetical protein
MSDDDGIKSFLPDLWRFFKNLFGADFETYVAPFAPVAIHMDARGFFSFCFFGQDVHSLSFSPGDYRNLSNPPNPPLLKGGKALHHVGCRTKALNLIRFRGGFFPPRRDSQMTKASRKSVKNNIA